MQGLLKEFPPYSENNHGKVTGTKREQKELPFITHEPGAVFYLTKGNVTLNMPSRVPGDVIMSTLHTN